MESAAVAAALDIELPVSIHRGLEAEIVVGDHKTSTCQDLGTGETLELDCMSGEVSCGDACQSGIGRPIGSGHGGRRP